MIRPQMPAWKRGAYFVNRAGHENEAVEFLARAARGAYAQIETFHDTVSVRHSTARCVWGEPLLFCADGKARSPRADAGFLRFYQAGLLNYDGSNHAFIIVKYAVIGVRAGLGQRQAEALSAEQRSGVHQSRAVVRVSA